MNLSSESIDPWQHALQNARLRSPASFDQWFWSVQFDGLNDGVLGLTARDEFVRDWVKTHFLPAMIGDLEQVTGAGPEGCIRVDWRISSQLAAPIGVLPEAERPSSPPPSQRPPSSQRPSHQPPSSQGPSISKSSPPRTDVMNVERDPEAPRSSRRPPAADPTTAVRAIPRLPWQRQGDP